jgi:hypothetical protein
MDGADKGRQTFSRIFLNFATMKKSTDFISSFQCVKPEYKDSPGRCGPARMLDPADCRRIDLGRGSHQAAIAATATLIPGVIVQTRE